MTQIATSRPPNPPPGKASAWQWFYFNVMTLLHSGLPILWWVRPHWTTKQMDRQDGKVVVITGANSGTGFATAKAYYDRGAKVYVLCRSEERANKAMEDIRRGGEMSLLSKMTYTPSEGQKGSLHYVHIDLTDLTTVDTAAKSILDQEDKIDILFANAGIMATPPGEYTKQGYSLQFGTNVLGHQRLISHLLPCLRRTSAAHPDKPARLIVLSSAAHSYAPRGGIDYSAVQKGGKIISEWAEYGQSKWGDIALAKYVDAHYGPRSGTDGGKVIAIAVHPGLVATNLYAHLSYAKIVEYVPWVLNLMNVTASVGALNQIWAAELPVPEAEELSGGYVACYQVRGAERPDLNDKGAIDKLWEWCSAQGHRYE